MAICEKSGKKRATGNNVSHAMNKTKRVFGANIQKIKVRDEDGTVRRMSISASELRHSDEILKPAPRKLILAELKKAEQS